MIKGFKKIERTIKRRRHWKKSCDEKMQQN